MSLRAGQLTERITVQRPPAARDDWGERTGTWADAGTFAASVAATGGRERPADEGTAGSTAYTIRVRHDSATAQIGTTDRIVWRGRTIDITAVVPDDRRTEITITGSPTMAKGTTITGDAALARALRTLGDRVQKRVLRSAVAAAAKPIQRAAKAKAAKESGLLKRSLGTRVKAHKDGTVTARVGPRTNVQGTHKGRKRRPVRYAHLIEKGFIDAAGTFHPPRAFLAPAADEQGGAAIDAMTGKLREGIAREAAKGAGR